MTPFVQPINMLGNRITNLGAGVNPGDAPTLSQTQTLITTAIATALATTPNYKGPLDCSANPNYPAASVGEFYIVSVAGRLGGGAGVVVEVGDEVFCNTTTAAGDQATVGSNWNSFQKNLVQATQAGAGYLRFATTAEAQAQTDITVALAPGTLNDWAAAGNATAKTYVDTADATTLTSANTYTDSRTKKPYIAAIAPGVSNDGTQGYAVGSYGVNTATGLVYICYGVGTGTAVWRPINAEDYKSTTFASTATSSSTMADMVGAAVTTGATAEAYTYTAQLCVDVQQTSAAQSISFQLVVDGTVYTNEVHAMRCITTNVDQVVTIKWDIPTLGAGKIVKVQWSVASGTATTRNNGSFSIRGVPVSRLVA